MYRLDYFFTTLSLKRKVANLNVGKLNVGKLVFCEANVFPVYLIREYNDSNDSTSVPQCMNVYIRYIYVLCMYVYERNNFA